MTQTQQIEAQDQIQEKVTRYWDKIAPDFDAIYSGRKDPVSRALDRWLRRDIYQRFDWVMEHAGDVRGKAVCDVGCGSGRFVAELAKRGADHVMGIDVAPQMLKLARELVDREGVGERCDFALGDILDWKADRAYDCTIAIGFWDYIPDPSGRLKVIREITRERFLSAWPRRWTWRAPVRKVRLGVLGCPVYFFGRDDVYRLLEGAGFRVTRVDVVGKLYCVAAEPV
jgi:SAM-dependent methyltransferase